MLARLHGRLGEAICDVVKRVNLDRKDGVIEMDALAGFGDGLPDMAVSLGKSDRRQDGENAVVVRADERRWHDSEVDALKSGRGTAQPSRVASCLEESSVDAVIVAFGRIVNGSDEGLELRMVDARVDARSELAAGQNGRVAEEKDIAVSAASSVRVVAIARIAESGKVKRARCGTVPHELETIVESSFNVAQETLEGRPVHRAGVCNIFAELA